MKINALENESRNIAVEKEVSKVPLKKEDVDVIVAEMEVSTEIAERILRKNSGNLVEALVELTN